MAFYPPLPHDKRVVELKEDEIYHESIVYSTACWRQYVGTWEIKDSKFYLVGVTGKFKLMAPSAVFANGLIE